MKIGIITTNYDRPHIFDMWCRSITRLRKEVGYFPVVVASDKTDRIYCDNYDIEHVAFRNRPLGRKFNVALRAMRKHDVDYVMIVGSDDILSNELLNNIIKATEAKPSIIGVDTLYFYSTRVCDFNRLLKYHRRLGYVFGVCRTIRRDILDAVDWHLWTDGKNYGLDADCWNKISPYTDDVVYVDGMVVDVKTQNMSINKFSTFIPKSEERDPQEFMDILSEEEKEIISYYRKLYEDTFKKPRAR